MCEKGTKFVSRCWGLLLKGSKMIERSFHSQKTLDFVTKSELSISHAVLTFHINITQSFTTDRDFSFSIKNYGNLKIVSAKK